MRLISARSNPLYQRLQRIAQGKRSRDAADACAGFPVLLEGLHLCQEWLRHRGQPEWAVFDDTRLAGDQNLVNLAARLDAQCVCTMAPALLAGLSPIAAAQGVLFLGRGLAPPLPRRLDTDAVWLDRIQDPGNVGTILRTVAASGMRQVFLSRACAQAWSPRVLRAAQGAHFVLDIHLHIDLGALTSRLDVPLLITSLQAVSCPVHEADLTPPCVWVFGNEGQGVDARLAAQAGQLVHIDQDPAVESLNVAVAAGICLFEQRRQRQALQKVRRSSPT